MTRFSFRQWTADRFLLTDRIGILLTLAIGLGGLIFVFSIPDPFASLPPQTPLLRPEDWPGSSANLSLGISTDGAWEEKRTFLTELYLSADTYAAGIYQTAIWYADPMHAAAYWNELDSASYQDEPIVTKIRGDGKPASMLFCGNGGLSLPEGFRECWYLVYWKHWYTEVNYRSTLTEDLHLLEMWKIATQVDQLLMSAPPEPCFWILCTGAKNDSRP